MASHRLSRERLFRVDTLLRSLQYLILTLGAVIMVLPFIWMLSTSLKPTTEILSWPPQFIPKTVTLDNYVTVFKTAPFHLFFLNSVLMASVSTASILITSTLAGFVFGKYNFPGRGFLFIVILATAMVPFETYMIPLYIQMKNLRLVNTFPALVAPYLIMSYGIFFMRQNVIAAIPDELLDAGRIGSGIHTASADLGLAVVQDAAANRRGPAAAHAARSHVKSATTRVSRAIQGGAAAGHSGQR